MIWTSLEAVSNSLVKRSFSQSLGSLIISNSLYVLDIENTVLFQVYINPPKGSEPICCSFWLILSLLSFPLFLDGSF